MIDTGKNHSECRQEFIRFILSSVILITPLVFSLATYNTFELNKLSFMHIMVLTALCIWMISFFRTGDLKFRFDPVLYYGLIFLILNIISVFFSETKYTSIGYLIDNGYYILFYVMAVNFFQKKDVQKISLYIIATGIIVSVYSVLQHYGIDIISWEPKELVSKRSISTLGNPIFLGFFLNMIIPFAVAQIFEKKIINRIAGVLSLLCFCCGIFFTYSRGAILTLGAELILFILILFQRKEYRKNLLKVLYIFMIFICIYFISGMSVEVMSQLRNLFDRVFAGTDVNVSTRLYLWKSAISIISMHPLSGIGPGNFSYFYLPFRHGEPYILKTKLSLAEYVHNDYLQAGVDYGLIAVFLCIMVIITVFIRALGCCFKRTEDDGYGLLSGALFVSFFSYLLNSFFSFSTVDSKIVLVFILSGISVLSGSIKEIHVRLFGRNVVRYLFLIFMTVILSVLILQVICGWTADVFIKKAVDQGHRGNIYSSVLFFNKALMINPFNEKYFSMRSKTIERCGYSVSDDVEKEVIKGYVSAIRINPLNPYNYADLARYINFTGQTKDDRVRARKSLLLYNEALKRDPYNSYFLNDTAMLLIYLNNYKLAENLLNESISIYPENENALINLGVLYFNEKKYDMAESLFRFSYRDRFLKKRACDYILEIKKIKGK